MENPIHISVSSAELETFNQTLESLIDAVNKNLNQRNDLSDLIGGNPISVLQDNHKNSGNFIANVLHISDMTPLIETMPWVYATYTKHGFSVQYFPVVFQAWIDAVNQLLPAPLAEKLTALYQWLIDHHEDWINASQQYHSPELKISKSWQSAKNEFLHALLLPDTAACLKLSQTHVQTLKDVKRFYMEVIQPSLYEIGTLWHNNEISIAQEHLASSIVTRVMSNIYVEMITNTQTKGKAVITAAPNEFHEIGAWMISDLLELDGWTVQYLGANTPMADLIQLMHSFLPDVLVISVTMFFNVSYITPLIDQLKSDPVLRSTQILIGGTAINAYPELAAQLKADATSDNAIGAVTAANRLFTSNRNI